MIPAPPYPTGFEAPAGAFDVFMNLLVMAAPVIIVAICLVIDYRDARRKPKKAKPAPQSWTIEQLTGGRP